MTVAFEELCVEFAAAAREATEPDERVALSALTTAVTVARLLGMTEERIRWHMEIILEELRQRTEEIESQLRSNSD